MTVTRAILTKELKLAAGIFAVCLLFSIAINLITFHPAISYGSLIKIGACYIAFWIIRIQLLIFYGTDRFIPSILLKRAGRVLWISEKDYKRIEEMKKKKQTLGHSESGISSSDL